MGTGEVARSVSRVGVIGDVHTEVDALAAAIKHLQGAGVDVLLCTGDIVDGPMSAKDVDRCCQLLQQAGVLTVSGNHDRWMQDAEQRDFPGATLLHELDEATREYVAQLPAGLAFETPAGRLLLCHGLGDDDMSGVKPHHHARELDENTALQALIRAGQYPFVINGHTHRRMVREIDGITLINAGTLLREHGSGCLFADFDQRRVTFFDIGDGGAVVEAEAASILT